MSPIINDDDDEDDDNQIRALIANCLLTNNFLIDYLDFDVMRDKYMSIAFGF